MSFFGQSGQRDRDRRGRSVSERRGDRSSGHEPAAVTRGAPSPEFRLYVEGPRDRDILQAWAHRLSPALARSLNPCAVILGGRQPARAVEHFRSLGGAGAGVRGLVVLDRDHHSQPQSLTPAEPGLELFTWRRRHIESYVLVPAAIRRFLDLGTDVSRAERLIDDHIPPPDDEDAYRRINAKQMLGSKGALARGLGGALSAGGIARCMRAEEFHPDILELYDRIRHGLGLREPVCEVIRRPMPL